MSLILGIDVGGTGIKGSIVDVSKGIITEEKMKIATPSPSTPDNMLKTVKKIIKAYEWEGKTVGIGFPATLKNGVVINASNIDKSWIDYPIKANWEKSLKTKINVVNDADAAGIAEMSYGKGKDLDGVVLFLTLGTGIGSALFQKKHLIPNTEFGHVIFNRKIAEKVVANSIRESKHMTWKTYGKLLNTYLERMVFLVNPDNILIGGGISKKFELYKPYLTLNTEVSNAELYNDAGIIGAACRAAQKI
jgi:polyphosphate glucokinase